MRPDHVIAIFIAAALGLGIGIAGVHEHHYQQTQKAAQASEAVQRAEMAVAAREEAKATAVLASQRDTAQARAGELQGLLDATAAERDQLKDKVKALEASSVGLGSGPVSLEVASSAGPNRFVPGQCTWYVASRRNVPWFGNAGQWLGAAQAYGFPTGWAPRPGAIMVTRESWYGHVAIVESVNGSWWTVSEMNYVAPYVVDQRTLTYGKLPLVGFIY